MQINLTQHINKTSFYLSVFFIWQPLCEDEGRPAGGAEAAGGQDPAGRGAAEGAEGESGAGARNRYGNVNGIWILLRKEPKETAKRGL